MKGMLRWWKVESQKRCTYRASMNDDIGKGWARRTFSDQTKNALEKAEVCNEKNAGTCTKI